MFTACAPEGLAPDDDSEAFIFVDEFDSGTSPPETKTGWPDDKKEACEIELIDVGDGMRPILLANENGYALAINENKASARVVQFDRTAKVFQKIFNLPESFENCTREGRACTSIFSFTSGAAERDGFVFNISTGFSPSLTVKVMGQSMERLRMPPRADDLWFFDTVFTEDAAFGLMSCVGPPYACLAKRDRHSYERLEGAVYSVPEPAEPFAIAHQGSVVAFGTSVGSSIAVVVADTATNRHVRVPLPRWNMYPPIPVEEIKRVLTTPQGGFLALWFEGLTTLWQTTHHAAFITKEGKMVHDVRLNPGVRDLVRVGNGFIGVTYNPIMELRVGFQTYTEDMVERTQLGTIELVAQGFNHNDYVAAVLPTIACVDARHCAAAWPTTHDRVMVAAINCK